MLLFLKLVVVVKVSENKLSFSFYQNIFGLPVATGVRRKLFNCRNQNLNCKVSLQHSQVRFFNRRPASNTCSV